MTIQILYYELDGRPEDKGLTYVSYLEWLDSTSYNSDPFTFSRNEEGTSIPQNVKQALADSFTRNAPTTELEDLNDRYERKNVHIKYVEPGYVEWIMSDTDKYYQEYWGREGHEDPDKQIPLYVYKKLSAIALS